MVVMSELDAGIQEYLEHIRADYNKNGWNNKMFYFTCFRDIWS